MAPPEKRKDAPPDADALAEAVENARRKAAVRTKTLWAEDPQGPKGLPELNYGTKDDAREILVSKEQYDRMTGALEGGAGGIALLGGAAVPAEEEAVPAPAPAAPEGPDAWGDWRRVPDASSGKCYYYNAVTAETTWTQPAGWGSVLRVTGRGYFYSDLSGVVQGPFAQEQLVAWRGVLPLEMPVWWSDGADGGAAPGSAAMTHLAVATGDAELLALLRSGQLPLRANATATQVEELLAQAAAVADAEGAAWYEAQAALQDAEEQAAAARAAAGDDEGGGGGGFSVAELAAAALAGLPPDERQRVLSGGAVEPAPPRRSDLTQDEYESAPVLNKLTGRLTYSSAGALLGQEGREELRAARLLDHHCDPTKLNEWLEQMKARKQEKVPRAVWQALKERRDAAKRKANTGWLRD